VIRRPVHHKSQVYWHRTEIGLKVSNMKYLELCVNASYSLFQNMVTFTQFQATVCFYSLAQCTF